MAIVRRRNEILKVKDDLVNHYVTIGYDVLDEAGNILQKAVPTDTIQLKGEYQRLTLENTQLKEQIAELKAKLEEISKPKSEEPVKTKRTRKSAEE